MGKMWKVFLTRPLAIGQGVMALKYGRVDVDWKEFFIMRVEKHWNKLPREVMGALSLETFKARLDWALSNLV